MSENYSAAVTLDSLKEGRTIPILGINSGDFWIVAGFATVGYAIGVKMSLGLVPLGVLIAGGVIVGVDLVRSAPPYCNAIQWIRAVIAYYRSPSKYANAAQAHVDTESSLRAAVEAPASTREQTHISRFYPPHGVFERDDESFGAILEYQPPNMDFATDDQYVDLMNMLAGWYNNNEIDFDITVHATTQPVDMEEYFDRLDSRVQDPEATYNETFRLLLEEMRADRRQQLEASDTEILRVYFILSVDPTEVADVVGGDDRATERSRLFRLISRVTPSRDTGEELPDDVDSWDITRHRMEKKLNHRIQRVQELAIGHNIATDANVRQVTAAEAAAVLESYWTGRPLTDLSNPGSDGIAPTGPLSPNVSAGTAPWSDAQ